MADEITMVSTTQSQEEINEALGLPAPAKEAPVVTAATEQEEGEEQQEEHAAQQPAKGAKPKKSAQDRINELTREKYELREKLARLEGATGKKDGAEATPAKEAPKVVVPLTRAKPDKDDPKYQTYEDYTEDLAGWKAEQLRAQEKAQEADEKRNARLREKFDGFQEQIKEAQEAHDDWDEVFNAPAENLQVPKIFDVAVPDLPNGAEVMYYVATHPEFRQKLLAMNDGYSDVQIISELSRVSDYLLDQAEEAAGKPATAVAKTAPTASATSAVRSVSAAPVPLKPVGSAGSSPAAAKKPLADVPYKEYKRRRAAGEG